MPNRCAAVLTALVAASIPLAALAQIASPAAPPPATKAAPTNNVAPVTVAAPAKPRAIKKRTFRFVQSYAAPTAVLDQFARWRDPVCVLVMGLAPEEAASAKARIYQVAKGLGLKRGGSACQANIEIVFSDQPQDLLDRVAAHSDWVLGFHYPSQTSQLKTVTRPVQAWYATATLGGGANDVELSTMHIGSASGGGGAAGTGGGAGAGITGSIGLPVSNRMESLDTPAHGPPNGCGDSRFSSCRASVFANVLVVIDKARVQGRPWGPLTDYLAMVALSQPRSLDGCMELPSVIDLLASPACPGRDAPDGLTKADAAYLTALYAADPEADRSGQQAEMAARMAKILIRADAPKR